MKLEPSTWLSLLGPTLIGGPAVAVCAAWILGSPAVAVFVVTGCLVGAAGSAWTIMRNARDAGALLRRPELRASTLPDTGVYRPLLEEMFRLLEHAEWQASEAGRSKTELEARAHVRRKQVRQLEAALEGLDSPLLITDDRNRPQFLNPAAARLFGKIEPDGRAPDPNQVPALGRLLEETTTRNAATDRRTAEFELPLGNEMVAYRATAKNVYDEDHRLIGVVTFLHDIGNERQEKTRHAEFVSSVCHELKTPMAGIKAFTEMLTDGDVADPDEQQELYGFIDAQVDRLTRLVNNMLNLARIESGVIEVQREDCELNHVLQTSLEVVRQLAEEKQVRLLPELSELYLAVHVDRDLFGQAVINLLSNAVKYTPQGGEVRLRSRMEEDRAVVEVHDTGMGIPEESLPRIFDRFYRVPENDKAAAGTGLGLSLVNYIVTELHNGTIDVVSSVDRGTSFTVTVPRGHRDRSRRRPPASLCTT